VSYSERFQEMEKGLDLAQAMAEADRCLLCHDPPCSKECPAETDPGLFIRKLRLRNVTGAIRTIKENNPLGGACGVLCPTPRLCEKACSATGIARSVEIGKIQRALIEYSWKTSVPAPQVPEGHGGKVAVVGSGPAGLSCAADLARHGFSVTVFEERAEPGGVIRYGVPAYRFDTAFLKHELADIQSLGVKFVCGTHVEGAKGAENLLAQGYQAVFLAPGLWGAERIPGGENVEGVFTSVDFLASLREGRFAELAAYMDGKSVAVIGGGSVAMDCVQSALKLGARDAYLVYRRSFSQMPAEEDERLAALRLGAHFLALNQPVKYQVDSAGKLSGIALVRTVLGQEDASGRRAPSVIKGSEWTLEVSAAIEAIGNRVDSVDWSGAIKVDRKGLILADGKTGKTSAKTIYAGGDIVRGPGLVVEAVQDGKLAARTIREALS
jgi:glutamate synthase (NADPH) small chain